MTQTNLSPPVGGKEAAHGHPQKPSATAAATFASAVATGLRLLRDFLCLDARPSGCRGTAAARVALRDFALR